MQTVLNPTTLTASALPDLRIVSALAWCVRRGVRRFLLAAPFALDPATRAFVKDRAEVHGFVLWPGQPDAVPSARDGVFIPEDYNWRLPPGCPPAILLIDGRGALTARMIVAALRRRVRTVIHTEFGEWQQHPLPWLAAAKLGAKLAARCLSASGAGGGLCQSVLDYGYRRSLRPALAGAPFLFGARPPVPPAGPRRGVVLACPTLVAGGAERQIVNTAIGLVAAGVGPVTVLVARLHHPPGNAFFLDPLVAAGVQVREIASPESGLARWLGTRALRTSPDGQRTLAMLRRLPQGLTQEVLDLGAELAALNPAVVHCWLDYSNVRAGLAAALAGVPRIVLSGRNVGPRHFPYIHEPWMRSIYRALLDQPGVVFSNNSRGGAADYAAWLRIDPARIQIIYNGVDTLALRRPLAADRRGFRERHAIGASVPLVIGMFRCSAEKRPLLWLEVAERVARQHADVSFLVFGQGPLREAMQRFVEDRGLAERIRLLPPTQDTALVLASGDLLLLTSQWEGTPNVAIEAQSVGTPVVLTGGGGAAEALADGQTGLYIAQPDAGALAQAMLQLLADEPRRAAMAAAGPGFVQARFGLNNMIDFTWRTYGKTTLSVCH